MPTTTDIARFSLALGLTALISDAASACQCRGKPPTEVLFSSHSYVFVGRVISGKFLGDGSLRGGPYGREFILAPSEILKGSFDSKEVIVRTGMADGDCGAEFSIGYEYLVYANRTQKGDIATGLCDYTKLYHPYGKREVHEIKALIQQKEAGCDSPLIEVPLLISMATPEAFARAKRGELVLSGTDVGDPNQTAIVCRTNRMWKDKNGKSWTPLPAYWGKDAPKAP